MSSLGQSSLEDWEMRLSQKYGQWYYHNKKENKSTWELPDGMSEEDAKKLHKVESSRNAQKKGDALNVDNTELSEKSPAQTYCARHILVKHRGSRRPSSWREPSITRTYEEAVEILRSYKKQIDQASDKLAEFGNIASEYSDCSSHTQAGDLGRFSKGQMQKPFEDAVASLSPGSISDVVITDSGVHLILRTE